MAKQGKNKKKNAEAGVKVAKPKATKKRTRAKKTYAKMEDEAIKQAVVPAIENDPPEEKEKEVAQEPVTHLAKWTTLEYIKTKDETLFYYLSIAGSIFMVISAMLAGNFVTAITFLLLIMVIMMQLHHEPREIECKIDLDGITTAGKLYRYDAIESFEISQKNGLNILKFKLKNSVLPNKEVYIAEQDPYYINAALEYFLPSEQQVETLVSFHDRKEEDGETAYAGNLEKAQEGAGIDKNA